MGPGSRSLRSLVRDDVDRFDFQTANPEPSLRGANGSRECAPDDRLREAIHRVAKKEWIASSLRSSQ
jgi:hypothetical protein